MRCSLVSSRNRAIRPDSAAALAASSANVSVSPGSSPTTMISSRSTLTLGAAVNQSPGNRPANQAGASDASGASGAPPRPRPRGPNPRPGPKPPNPGPRPPLPPRPCGPPRRAGPGSSPSPHASVKYPFIGKPLPCSDGVDYTVTQHTTAALITIVPANLPIPCDPRHPQDGADHHLDGADQHRQRARTSRLWDWRVTQAHEFIRAEKVDPRPAGETRPGGVEAPGEGQMSACGQQRPEVGRGGDGPVADESAAHVRGRRPADRRTGGEQFPTRRVRQPDVDDGAAGRFSPRHALQRVECQARLARNHHLQWTGRNH